MIGLTGIQSRRFERFTRQFESLLTEENLPGPSNQRVMGLIATKHRSSPWAEKKYGYIPFPKTDRAKFLNEEVLPSFYECQWKWSKNARSFQQNFHAEGRRQYDHHTKLKDIQERFTLWTEQLPQDIGMKPTDLKSIKYRIAQLQNFMENVQKLRNSVEQDDASAFTKAGKLKSGQECSHKFNGKCFGVLAGLKTKILESLTKMQTLEDKNKRLYPVAKGGSASKKRRQKENRTKSKKRRIEREGKSCQRVFSLAVASSCSYGDKTVESHLLNKDAISKMGKRDVKWLKLLFEKKMFTKEAIQVCNTLNPNLETDSDTDTDDDFTDAD